MSERSLWRDAEFAARDLTPLERRTLLLLTRLPLIWAEAIARLDGLQGPSSIYRCLGRLEAAALIRTIRPALRPGTFPRLAYLTDLGLATIAVDQGVEVRDLATRNGLTRSGLLRLLPGLPHLVSVYELLAALAAARPGCPDLLEWERPWRRRYHRASAKAAVHLKLPAYAALCWGDTAQEFLLLPDLATFPLREYETTVRRMAELRAREVDALPVLVVGTTDNRRASAWNRLVDEVCRAQREARLAVRVARWSSLRDDLDRTRQISATHAASDSVPVSRVTLERILPRSCTKPVPRLVGPGLESSIFPNEARAERQAEPLTLVLAPTDYSLLDLVGRHPFLSAEDMAAFFGWKGALARWHLNRLVSLGLMRPVSQDEVCSIGALPTLVELTGQGLELIAAHQGLTLALAVRVNGLVGGGPDNPVGRRASLLRNREHTMGVNHVFARIAASARRLAMAGGDDALVEWRPAAACAGRGVHPDGYGIYHRSGKLNGFFLEYDRGTAKGRDYRAKFAGYYAYRSSGRFEREYEGFPTILIVTSGPGSERRIAKSIRVCGLGREPALPVLLTTEGRLEATPSFMLTPVWQEPVSLTRVSWPGPRFSHELGLGFAHSDQESQEEGYKGLASRTKRRNDRETDRERA
jgi:hypothetical protein